MLYCGLRVETLEPRNLFAVDPFQGSGLLSDYSTGVSQSSGLENLVSSAQSPSGPSANDSGTSLSVSSYADSGIWYSGGFGNYITGANSMPSGSSGYDPYGGGSDGNDPIGSGSGGYVPNGGGSGGSDPYGGGGSTGSNDPSWYGWQYSLQYGEDLFQWPDAPSYAGGPAKPENTPGEQPAPAYDGPELNYSADPNYAASVQSANNTANAARATNTQTYEAAKALVNAAYDAAAASAGAQKGAAMQAAGDAYNAGMVGTNPYDLEAAGVTQQNAIEQAEATYQTAVTSINNAEAASMMQAMQAYFQAIAAAEAARQAAIEAANNAYNSGSGDPYGGDPYGGDPYGGNSSASNAHRDALADADYKYEVAVANAAYSMALASNAATKTKEDALADAELVRDKAIHQAAYAYGEVAANYDFFEDNNKVATSKQYEIDKANAERVYAKAMAAAQRNKDQGLADAKANFDSTSSSIQKTQTKSLAQAAKAAAQVWANSLGTAWSTYALQVEVLTQDRTIAVAYAQRVANSATADALRVEAYSKANATYNKAVKMADATADRVIGRANAEALRAGGAAGADLSRKLSALADHKERDDKISQSAADHRKAIAAAAKTYNDAQAQVNRDHSITIAGINRDYAKNAISASQRDAQYAAAALARAQSLRPHLSSYQDAVKTADKTQYETDLTTQKTFSDKETAREKSRTDDNADEVQGTEITLATVGAAFSKANAQADGDELVAIANAEATRVTSVGNAERTLAQASANAHKTAADGAASAHAAFFIGQANAHVSAVNAWAAANPSPYTTFRAAAATIARGEIVAKENAAVTRSSVASTAYVQAISSAANSSVTQLVAHVNAEVVEANSISAAALTLADAVGVALVSAGTDISSAVTAYDKAVSAANKAASDADTAAQKVRNRTIHFAQLDYAVAMGLALFDLQNLITNQAAYMAAVEAAGLAYRTAVANAEGTYTIAAANIRKANTAAVGAQKTMLTAAVGTTNTSQTSAISAAESVYQVSAGNAGKTSLYTKAAADETHTNDVSAAITAWNTSVIGADQAYLHTSAKAEADRDKANAAATATYEKARSLEYATLVQNWANQQGTLHAQFLADIAQAEADWAVANEPVYTAYVNAQVNAELSGTDQIIDKSASRLLAESGFESTFETAKAANKRASVESSADAGLARVASLSTATKAQTIALSTATSAYNNSLAQATEAFENASASAGVAYVNAVVPAKKQWYIDGQTEAATAAYQAVEQQQLLIKYQATGNANVTLQQTRGDATVAWKEAVGTADVDAAIAFAQAATKLYKDVRDAENTRASSDRSDFITRSAAEASGASQFAKDIADINVNQIAQLADAEVNHSIASEPAALQFSEDFATAEANLRIAEANNSAIAAQQQAAATGMASDQYYAALMGAHRDYIVAYSAEFIAYRVASSQAGSTLSIENSKAERDADNSFAQQIRTQRFAEADAAKVRLNDIAAATGDYAVSVTTLFENHKVKLAEDREAAVPARANGKKTYHVDMAKAQRAYDVAWATIWVQQNGPNPPDQPALNAAHQARETAKKTADADAALARDISEAQWTKSLNLSLAAADSDFRTGESQAYLTKQETSANAEKTFQVAVAEAVKVQQKAQASMRSVLWQKNAENDKAYGVSIAEAQAEAFVADAVITAPLVQGLATQYSDPWLDYYADRMSAIAVFAAQAKTEFVSYHQEIGDHNVSYAQTVGQAYVTVVDGVADALKTHAVAQAENARKSTVDRASARHTYVMAVAPATKDQLVANTNAEFVYAVAAAQAQHDYAISGDDPSRQQALITASNQRSSSQQAAQETFGQEQQGAMQTYATTLAQSSHDTWVASATARHTLGESANGFIKTFVITRAGALETQTVDDATSTRDQKINLANAYATAMQAFAIANGTSWAQADAVAAMNAAVVAANEANGAYNNAVTSAASEKLATISHINQSYADGVAASAQELQSTIDYADMVLSGELWVIQNTPWLISLIAPSMMAVERGQDFLYFTEFASVEDIPDWFERFNGARLTGPQGDGFYTGLVSAMLTNPSAPNDGYSWAYHRWIGEGLIRPLLGDEWLGKPSNGTFLGFDYEVWGLTLAYSIPVGIMIFATQGAILQIAASGAAYGFLYGMGDQLIDTYWYHDQAYINWDVVGTTTVGGALIGPLMKIPVVNTAIAGFMSYSFTMNAYTEFTNGRYVAAAYEGIWAAATIIGTAKLARNQYIAAREWVTFLRGPIEYPGCFEAGTEIVMADDGSEVQVAEGTWNLSLLVMAGVTATVGVAGAYLVHRKRIDEQLATNSRARSNSWDDRRDKAIRELIFDPYEQLGLDCA